MTIAVYPGTFDPVTNGHVDITARAALIFDQLIVGVYDSPPKAVLFSTGERVRLFRKAVRNIPNVRVISYSGLTVQFARQMDAKVIVRGLRVTTDFEYEFEMALMNRKLDPQIDVVSLMAAKDYLFLSSSRIKEVARLGGDVTGLIPPHVAAALGERLNKMS